MDWAGFYSKKSWDRPVKRRGVGRKKGDLAEGRSDQVCFAAWGKVKKECR